MMKWLKIDKVFGECSAVNCAYNRKDIWCRHSRSKGHRTITKSAMQEGFPYWCPLDTVVEK